jgi:hypothetical protein
MTKDGNGVFEVNIPNLADGSSAIPHGSRVKIHLEVGLTRALPKSFTNQTDANTAV